MSKVKSLCPIVILVSNFFDFECKKCLTSSWKVQNLRRQSTYRCSNSDAQQRTALHSQTLAFLPIRSCGLNYVIFRPSLRPEVHQWPHRASERRFFAWSCPRWTRCLSATVASVNRELDSSFSPSHSKTQVLIGGVPQELSDKALRAAVEQSGDDSQVTVHIDIAEDLRDTRLDTFLSSRITALSRSALARLIRAESVSLNGKIPKPASKLRAGDHVIVHLPPPPSSDVLPENIPLDVLLEDDQIIVVNKQSDLVVHPAPTAPAGTLVNALMWHLLRPPAPHLPVSTTADHPGTTAAPRVVALSSVGADRARPGIVHRLDRNTTGAFAGPFPTVSVSSDAPAPLKTPLAPRAGSTAVLLAG